MKNLDSKVCSKLRLYIYENLFKNEIEIHLTDRNRDI